MAPASTHSDSATNEKVDTEVSSPVVQPQKPKKGFFSKKSKAEPTELDEKAADVSLEPPKEVKKDVPPASFTSLFRYVPRYQPSRRSLLIVPRFSTPLELTLNAIGLVCAAAGGAAQVRRPVSNLLSPSDLACSGSPL